MGSPAITRRPGPIIAVLAMTGVVATGIQTLVVPLIGQLPLILGATAGETAWVVTATLLTSAVAVPISGRLGDMYGTKPVVIASLMPLILGSLICASAGSLTPMVVGRGLQGLGLGVVPLGISLLREVMPPEKMTSAVATMSASMGIGGALGLPFAALVGQSTSWRVMFWTFAGLAAVALVLVVVVVPRGSRPAARPRFDLHGAIALSVGLVSLLLMLSRGSQWGWGSAATLEVAVVALIALGLWVARQLTFAEPLVNLRKLADRAVLCTNVAALLISFSTYPLSYVVPQILQLPAATGYGLGQSMLSMALWLAPGGLAMLVVAPLSARISAKFGPRTTLIAGAGTIALGFASSRGLMGSTWGLMAVVMACNIGLAMAYAAIPVIIMGAVPVHETASANGFNTLCRAMGTSVAGAVIGGLLANGATQVGDFAAPSLASLHSVMGLGAGVAVLAAAIALAIPRHAALHTTAPTRTLPTTVGAK